MIKERIYIFSRITLAVDIALTFLAFLLTYWLRSSIIPLPPGEIWNFGRVGWLLFIIIPLWLILLPYEDAYLSIEKSKPSDTYVPVIKATVEGILILFAVIFLTKAFAQSRLFVILFGIIDAGFLLLERKFIFLFIASREIREVLIIGAGNRAKKFADFFEGLPFKFRIKGFLTIPDEEVAISESKILGSLRQFSSFILRSSLDWVVIASKNLEAKYITGISTLCQEMGIPVSYELPDISSIKRTRVDAEIHRGLSYITVSTAPRTNLLLSLKYIGDRIFAFLMLLTASPLLIIIAFLIRIDSRGSVLFKQIRCGLNGRKFTFYKFRTMVEGAELLKEELIEKNLMSGVTFKMRDDPRVTKIGRFLRRTSLDELPQLFNCLRGEMSFVGPRPPLPEEVKKYTISQRRRLSMKPGLTCIWQVSGRNEIDFSKWMNLDLSYIDNWSPFLDLKILFKTIPAIIFGKGAY
jgi:exopolysaccharide biosynthesis polyprenyl glycosylphosphotransferase